MKSFLLKVSATFIPIAVAVTGAFTFTYVAVQQNYRQSANDPQIQMAEDAAQAVFQSGAPASAVVRGVPPVDIATSLDPWTEVYDSSGMPLEANAVLDGAPPQLPKGLFEQSTWKSAKTYQAPTGPETRVTWQPREGVRQAVVLVALQSPNGTEYVAVGRSLLRTEDRILTLTTLLGVAWVFTMAVTLITTVIATALLQKHSRTF